MDPAILPGLYRIIVLLCVAAALILSTWLGVTALTDPEASLAACGELGDCQKVLSTRWSRWFDLPVSLLAAAVYGLLLLAACGATTSRGVGVRRLCTVILVGGGGIVAASAVWFLVLQSAVVGAFCPYCTVVHACGLLAAVTIFVGLRQTEEGRQTAPASHLRALAGTVGVGPRSMADSATRSARRRPTATLRWASLTAVLFLVILLGGQLASSPPATHLVQEVHLEKETVAASPTTYEVQRPDLSDQDAGVANDQDEDDRANPSPGVREISLVGGGVSFLIDDLPLLGSKEAPHVVMELFDYTCPNCRLMAKYIKQAQERYPQQLAVAVMPAPLSHRCNEHLGYHVNHRDACTYARYAMAVWRANPSAFAEFHEQLMEGEKAPPPREARALAARLGGSTFRDLLLDRGTTALVQRGVEIYGKLKGGKIPKLLLPSSRVIVGAPRTPEEFFTQLEEELSLTPVAD